MSEKEGVEIEGGREGDKDGDLRDRLCACRRVTAFPP